MTASSARAPSSDAPAAGAARRAGWGIAFESPMGNTAVEAGPMSPKAAHIVNSLAEIRQAQQSVTGPRRNPREPFADGRATAPSGAPHRRMTPRLATLVFLTAA